MAVHDLLAGVSGGLLREAVGDDLGAPAHCAPPLLSRYTHGGCDWFTGICSVPDRVAWLATGTDRNPSCGRSRRGDATGEDVEAPLTAAVGVPRAHGPMPFGTGPC